MKENSEKASGKSPGGEKISRKKAIIKVGYAAFSAATMMLLLNNPAKAQNGSPVVPGDDWGGGDGWG